jgi:hypothetical protein
MREGVDRSSSADSLERARRWATGLLIAGGLALANAVVFYSIAPVEWCVKRWQTRFAGWSFLFSSLGLVAGRILLWLWLSHTPRRIPLALIFLAVASVLVGGAVLLMGAWALSDYCGD